MNRLKNNWLRATLMLFTFFMIGSISIANVTQNNSSSKEIEDKDPKSKATESKLVDEPYYYTGPITNVLSTLQDTTHWQSTPPSEFTCGGLARVPCSIPAASQADLLSKLNTATTIDDVLDMADERRQASN